MELICWDQLVIMTPVPLVLVQAPEHCGLASKVANFITTVPVTTLIKIEESLVVNKNHLNCWKRNNPTGTVLPQ